MRGGTRPPPPPDILAVTAVMRRGNTRRYLTITAVSRICCLKCAVSGSILIFNDIDNYDINVGAIYYPVADYNNPPVVYPTDDAFAYGSGIEPTGSPTTVPTSEPTSRPSVSPTTPRPTPVRRQRAAQANDDQAQVATDDGGKPFPLL